MFDNIYKCVSLQLDTHAENQGKVNRMASQERNVDMRIRRPAVTIAHNLYGTLIILRGKIKILHFFCIKHRDI